jgi:NADPH:quinone reductase-like Zn-dependent oxidoreductase
MTLGAVGGVGSILIQLARPHTGLTVIATAPVRRLASGASILGLII